MTRSTYLASTREPERSYPLHAHSNGSPELLAVNRVDREREIRARAVAASREHADRTAASVVATPRTGMPRRTIITIKESKPPKRNGTHGSRWKPPSLMGRAR